MTSHSGRRGFAIALIVLLVAAASRVGYLFAGYTVGVGGVQRHHVESAATIFFVIGCTLAIVRGGGGAWAGDAAGSIPVGRWLAPAFCALAVALYWPALFIGPLSDDFILIDRASNRDLSAVSTTLFRPIPLLLWSAVLSAGGGPAALHALNVLLHGLNAWLSAQVIGEWVPSPSWAIAGGLFVLTAPLAPEAVAWTSGIFDVSAATLVLTSVLLSRRYRTAQTLTPGIRVLFVAVSLAAVLCKETAAVGPVLSLLMMRFPREADSRTRAFLRDVGLVVVAIALFGAARFVLAPEPSLFHVSKYAVQRTLFAAFGALASPFHEDVKGSLVWLPVASVLLLIGLLTAFFAARGPGRHRHGAFRGFAWILLAIAPAWAILVVPANLEASRFLYLAGVGWALAIAAAGSSVAAGRSGSAYLTAGVVVALLSFAAIATRVHLRHWQEAAAARDTIVRAVLSNARVRSCSAIAIADPPDSVRGAYVFRNGLAEALAANGVAVVPAAPDPACDFRWNPSEVALTHR